MSIMGKMGEWQVCAVCCNTKRLLREKPFKKKTKCPKCRPGWRRRWWCVRVKQSRRVFLFIRQVVAQRCRIHVSVLGAWGLCFFFPLFLRRGRPSGPPCHNLNLSQSKHVRGPMMDSRVLHTSVTKNKKKHVSLAFD